MSDSLWVSSPCRGACWQQQGMCVRCGRTLSEVIEWPAAASERRSEIKQLAQQRLVQARSEVDNDRSGVIVTV